MLDQQLRPLDVRGDFPYVEECAYLNTASAGLSAPGQGAAVATFYEEVKRHGMNGMAAWRATADEARARIARLTGASPNEIRFASSTTEGLNLVLSAMPWAASDEVVLAADEFSSVVLACEHAQRGGATVRSVTVPNERDRTAALIAAVTPATRVVAVSHVHWITGTRVDLQALGDACRAVDARLVVDGAQALGATPVSRGDADIYCASVFKWLLSGFGLAVVIVRDRTGLAGAFEPVVRGYNNPPPSHELQYAHVNYPGVFALNASLAYLDRTGWPLIHAQIESLWQIVVDGLSERSIGVVTPDVAHAGIVSCRVADAAALRETLAERNVFVEARGGLLRVSPHFYNNGDDIAAFFDAVDRFHRR